jgi:hypothetical protein
MLSPEPGFIQDIPADCSLIHPGDINKFIIIDKTHHRFSTTGNKGGVVIINTPMYPSCGQATVPLRTSAPQLVLMNLRFKALREGTTATIHVGFKSKEGGELYI